MLLKNKALAIFDFLTAPSEKLYERAARFHYRALQDVMNGKAAYAGENLYVFHYFPESAAALGPRAFQNTVLAAGIKNEPMAALRLLLTDYKTLAATLESVVLSSSEAAYYLLKASREQKLALVQPDSIYSGALLRDPFWALRTWGDTQDEKLLAHCLQAARTQKEVLPGAAYLYLYFTPEADPADFVELLSTNPMYAYLASRHFYDRNIEFKYFGLKNLTPRWAYHFITDGFLDDEEGLIETMLGSPDWLVEYLVESERYKDLPYCGTLVEKTMKKAGANLQTIYLKLWWERTQEHVKNLPPPKPPRVPGTEKTEGK